MNAPTMPRGPHLPVSGTGDRIEKKARCCRSWTSYYRARHRLHGDGRAALELSSLRLRTINRSLNVACDRIIFHHVRWG